jgi:hypothetical protein
LSSGEGGAGEALAAGEEMAVVRSAEAAAEAAAMAGMMATVAVAVVS